MTRILTEAAMTRRRNYALHYATNWRNVEASWYPTWNDVFSKLLQESPLADVDLTFAPQYPLVQWGISRRASVRLTSGDKNPIAEPIATFEATDNEASDDETEPLKCDDPDYRPTGRRAQEVDPPTRTLRSSEPQSLIPPHLGLEVAVANPSTSAPSSTNHDGATTPPPLSAELAHHNHQETPSSVRTRPARDGQDSHFLLDYALVNLGDPLPNAPSHELFGHMVEYCEGDIPIVLEVKQAPSRSSYGAPGGFYYGALSGRFRSAYRDIHLKAPVAFRCHPLQQSIIGIAASGQWWSFTVIKRSDTEAVWSRGFLCGDENHDEVLRKLFIAARTYPANPTRYEDNWVKRFLEGQRRRQYDKDDCMTQGIDVASGSLM